VILASSSLLGIPPALSLPSQSSGQSSRASRGGGGGAASLSSSSTSVFEIGGDIELEGLHSTKRFGVDSGFNTPVSTFAIEAPVESPPVINLSSVTASATTFIAPRTNSYGRLSAHGGGNSGVMKPSGMSPKVGSSSPMIAGVLGMEMSGFRRSRLNLAAIESQEAAAASGPSIDISLPTAISDNSTPKLSFSVSAITRGASGTELHRTGSTPSMRGLSGGTPRAKNSPIQSSTLRRDPSNLDLGNAAASATAGPSTLAMSSGGAIFGGGGGGTQMTVSTSNSNVLQQKTISPSSSVGAIATAGGGGESANLISGFSFGDDDFEDFDEPSSNNSGGVEMNGDPDIREHRAARSRDCARHRRDKKRNQVEILEYAMKIHAKRLENLEMHRWGLWREKATLPMARVGPGSFVERSYRSSSYSSSSSTTTEQRAEAASEGHKYDFKTEDRLHLAGKSKSEEILLAKEKSMAIASQERDVWLREIFGGATSTSSSGQTSAPQSSLPESSRPISASDAALTSANLLGHSQRHLGNFMLNACNLGLLFSLGDPSASPPPSSSTGRATTGSEQTQSSSSNTSGRADLVWKTPDLAIELRKTLKLTPQQEAALSNLSSVAAKSRYSVSVVSESLSNMMAARSESSTSPGGPRTTSPHLLQRQEAVKEEAKPRYDQLHFPIIDSIPQLCNGLVNHQFSSLSSWADRNAAAVNKLDISVTAAQNHGHAFPQAPQQGHHQHQKYPLGKASSSKSASTTNSPALKGLSNSPALKVLAGGAAPTAHAPQAMAAHHPPPQSPSAMLIPGIRGLKVANFSLSESSMPQQQHPLQHQHQQNPQHQKPSHLSIHTGGIGQHLSQFPALSLAQGPGQLRRISQPTATSPIAVGSGGSSPQAVSSLVGAAAMPSQEWGAHLAIIQQQQQLQLAKQKAQLLQAQGRLGQQSSTTSPPKQ